MSPIIGIDIGLSGAIVCLDGETVQFADMPVKEDAAGKRIDAAALILILRTFLPATRSGLIAMEQINAVFGGPGGRAQGSLMTSRGVVHACCDIARLPFLSTPPAVWKRHLGLLGSKQTSAEKKAASRAMACTLFPKYRAQFARVKDSDKAEALLIALWARDTLT